jgi:hypothetical protein
LPNKLQVTEVAWWAFILSLLESTVERLVIGKDDKGTAFNYMLKVFDGFVYCQELAVVRSLLLLRGAELMRVQSQGLSSVAYTLLQGDAN